MDLEALLAAHFSVKRVTAPWAFRRCCPQGTDRPLAPMALAAAFSGRVLMPARGASRVERLDALAEGLTRARRHARDPHASADALCRHSELATHLSLEAALATLELRLIFGLDAPDPARLLHDLHHRHPRESHRVFCTDMLSIGLTRLAAGERVTALGRAVSSWLSEAPGPA